MVKVIRRYLLAQILEVPLLHKILWIQRIRDIPFLQFLVHQVLIIVRGLYPIDYGKVVSNLWAYYWQITMKDS